MNPCCCCCSLRTGGIVIAIFQLNYSSRVVIVMKKCQNNVNSIVSLMDSSSLIIIGWFFSLVKYSYLLDTTINFQPNSSALLEAISNSSLQTERDSILLKYENHIAFERTKWTIIYSFLTFVSLMAVVAAIMLLAGILKKSIGLMKLCVFIQIVNILTLLGIATSKSLTAREWEMPVVEILRIAISLYFIFVIGKLIEETKNNANVQPKENNNSTDPVL